MLVGNKFDESAELKEVTHTEGQAEAAAWGVIINWFNYNNYFN